MAAIDYHGILTSIRTILQADATTSGVPVWVEQNPQFGVQDTGRAFCLTLGSSSVIPQQSLAAGKRQEEMTTLSLWVLGFSMETFEKAAEVRDNLLGAAQLVLMKNRTPGGLCDMLWLEGISFESARDDNGMAFVALAEIQIKVRVVAINP